jgi:2'-5' RNA ligase
LGETAFVVLVPEAEALVRDLRRRFDPSAAAGVPAHVTVLYPFLPQQQLSPAVLARAAAALRECPAFGFEMAQAASFPGTAYLAPWPCAPFVALTEALVRAFHGLQPYGGAHPAIIPHLTVGRGTDEAVEGVVADLRRGLLAQGPVRAVCSELTVLENAAGRWREMRRLPLDGRRSL